MTPVPIRLFASSNGVSIVDTRGKNPSYPSIHSPDGAGSKVYQKVHGLAVVPATTVNPHVDTNGVVMVVLIVLLRPVCRLPHYVPLQR